MSNSGAGSIAFEKIARRTIVRKALAHAPLRLLTPRNQGQAAWVYTSTYGGGLVDGDHLQLTVEVGQHAEGVLLTQSATKVYRSPQGTRQSLDAEVADGASLLLLPDPTSCFAGSRFAQRQSVNLGLAASLLLVDTLNAGRVSRGERWQLSSFKNQLFVQRQGKKILWDSLLLDARGGELSERFGRFNSFSTLLFIGPRFEKYGHEVRAQLAQEIPHPKATTMVSASALPDEGVLVRLAAMSNEAAMGLIRQFFYFVPEILGDSPWARKW